MASHNRKKTFFYNNLMRTKAEEDFAAAFCLPHRLTRTVVDIREIAHAASSSMASRNRDDPPWMIRKSISTKEVSSGKLVLTHDEMFDQVFKHWSEEMCNNVVRGHKVYVIVVDVTDDKDVDLFEGENIFVEMGPNETYILRALEVVQKLKVHPGDEIGLFWEEVFGVFGFKMLRRRRN